MAALSDVWRVWGFTDEATFVAHLSPFMPDLSWLPGGPDPATVARSAWSDPASPYGAVAAAVLATGVATGGDVQAQTQAGSQGGQYAAPLITGGPMAPLIIPGCFVCSIRMQSGGRDVINVVGVQNTGGSAAGAANAVDAAWRVTSGPLNFLTATVSYLGVRAMDIGSANGAIAESTVLTGTGSSGGSSSTNAASALVKWNGGTRSASSRGRLYFGPIKEADINADGRTLTSTSITAINTAFTNFRNSLSGAGYPLVVLSRKTATAYPVVGSACESTIATQRRRIRS